MVADTDTLIFVPKLTNIVQIGKILISQSNRFLHHGDCRGGDGILYTRTDC